MSYPTRRLSLFFQSNALLWVIICLGVVLRFAQYQTNRSLWMDEAMLAVNIVNRSFSELLQPLDYMQAAPIGFLIVEKLAVQTFGNNEYALRLFPFLSGIISLFLFFSVAKHYVNSKAVPIALGLFAISGPLIYYSSEVKQYSSDVAIGLLLYWITIYIQSERLTVRRIFLFGVLGAIAVWFSHPAAFILAGIGGSLTLFCLVRKKWVRIGRLSIACLLWASSFVVVYLVSLHNLTTYETRVQAFRRMFVPFPPLSFSDVKWFVDNFFKIFEHPGGLYLSGLAAFAFLVGSTLAFLKKKEEFLLLISPILITLLASGFGKYPIKGRLLLFTAPIILLFVAEGTWQIIEKTGPNSVMIGVILVGLLYFQPLLSATYHLMEPRTHVGGYKILEEIKPVLGYVRDHKREGDILYLYHGSRPAFEYYKQRYGYSEGDYILGVHSKNNGSDHAKDLDKLKGKGRVWILFSHFQSKKDSVEKDFYLYYLDSMGTRLDSFESKGAVAFLYSLSKEAQIEGGVYRSGGEVHSAVGIRPICWAKTIPSTSGISSP